MYAIIYTREFDRDQLTIDPNFHRLARELKGSLDLLKEDPYRGEPVDGTRSIYMWSLRVFMGIQPLQLYYRIEEEGQLVYMLRMRAVEEPDP